VPGFGLRDPIRIRGRKTAAGLPFFH